nr:MAG TPA: hypothetical protein [Caudoviricetes sp.]
MPLAHLFMCLLIFYGEVRADRTLRKANYLFLRLSVL